MAARATLDASSETAGAPTALREAEAGHAGPSDGPPARPKRTLTVQEPLAEIKARRQELATSLKHLRRSNEILLQELDADPTDVDFREAVEENKGVIEKRVKQLAELDEQIAELEGALLMMEVRTKEAAEAAVPASSTGAGVPVASVAAVGGMSSEESAAAVAPMQSEAGLYL